MSRRKGELTSVELRRATASAIEFNILRARGIIGLRNPLLTATEGEAIIAHRFKGYEPHKGQPPCASHGQRIISQGTAPPLHQYQQTADRGRFFVHPGEEVYGGRADRRNSKTDETSW
ncbi:MAG: hypothetical protein IPH63_17595 [Flavobacteriales bacterium]|nr:hypothetical protein [Flavobacteriales bacterium]